MFTRLEPVQFYFRDYQIEVVFDPHKLSSGEKREIHGHLLEATKTGFKRPSATKEEVEEHTTSPGISTLILVKKTGKILGYYSTEQMTVNGKKGVYLAGSVLHHSAQGKHLFPVLQAFAMLAEAEKMQSQHEEPPHFVSARTQDAIVGKLLKRHGLHASHDPRQPETTELAKRIAEQLNPGKEFDEKKFIIRGAYGQSLYSPKKGTRLDRGLNVKKGDARLIVGKYQEKHTFGLLLDEAKEHFGMRKKDIEGLQTEIKEKIGRQLDKLKGAATP